MYRCAVDMLSFLGVKGFFKQAFKARPFYFKKQTTPQKSHNSNRNLEWKVTHIYLHLHVEVKLKNWLKLIHVCGQEGETARKIKEQTYQASGFEFVCV